MKTPPWFPHPAAWLSAVALLMFSRGLLLVAGIVLPLLMEVARVSPRLAALGGLLLWLSPIAVVSAGHRVLSATLDVRDSGAKKARPTAPLLHWWAGLYGWLVLFLATSTTLFIGTVINPPPVEPDGLFGLLAGGLGVGATIGVRTVVWVLVAAVLYDFERKARAQLAAGEG